MAVQSPPSSPALDAARRLVQQGRIAEAERAYAALLDDASPPPEAFSFLAMRAFQQKDPKRAQMFLEQALLVAPNESRFLTDLGVAHRAQQNYGQALDAFARAIKAAPGNFVARFHAASVYEALGRHREALIHYFGAVTTAQSQGQWISRETIKPSLYAEVMRAIDLVKRERRQVFDNAMAPLRAQYGGEALRRVEHCLSIYIREAPLDVPDKRQRPLMFYFPGIPSQPYFTRDQLPWMSQLEDAASVIREEAAAVTTEALPSFLRTTDPDTIAKSIKGADRPPSWNAFFFYDAGKRFDENHSRAPRTSAVIDALPQVRIRAHAPEICFSVLTPGTRILPHTGVTNARAVVHLPLIVPEKCALRVGGEEHAWREGRCVAFDDTFEHEAWNESENRIRVVLIMDTWNPHLTEAERAAFTALTESVGDFEREARA